MNEYREISKVMKKNVITLEQNRSISEAAKKMYKNKIGCLIITKKGALAGIVTEKDIVKAVSDDISLSSAVDEIMSSPITSISSSDDVVVATNLMKMRGFRRMPIVDNGQLVGIITLTDLADIMQNLTQTYSAEMASMNMLINQMKKVKVTKIE